jgi:hypothetical protein
MRQGVAGPAQLICFLHRSISIHSQARSARVRVGYGPQCIIKKELIRPAMPSTSATITWGALQCNLVWTPSREWTTSFQGLPTTNFFPCISDEGHRDTRLVSGQKTCNCCYSHCYYYCYYITLSIPFGAPGVSFLLQPSSSVRAASSKRLGNWRCRRSDQA